MVQFVDLAGRVRYRDGAYFGPKTEVAKLQAAQSKWDDTVNATKPSGTPSQGARNSSFVESVVTGVANGKRRDQIAKELGLTPAQLDAQLASCGLQLSTNVNKNRETQSTEIIDKQTGKVISADYQNYDEGTHTSRATDDAGVETIRTEDAEGKITESVTDAEGVVTKTTTEPINDGAPIEYEVQPGDNLTVIAADHGIGLEDLRESNPGLFEDPRDPDLIYAGEKVTIEGGTRTTIEITKDGHTVTIQSDGSEADMARDAIFEDGATVEQVAQAQGMTPDEVLEMLEAAGIWIDKVAPVGGDGDVETIRIADPSTNMMVIQSYDYQHDAVTRTVIDEQMTFSVPITDPQSGEVVASEVSGALGYLENEVVKSTNLEDARLESLPDLIVQAQKQAPEAVPGLRAELKDAKLDVSIARADADTFTAASQKAEADQLVAAAYDLVEQSVPGTEAYNGAKTILGQALDYTGRVADYGDAVDANRTMLDAEKNLRSKDAIRRQAGADLQEAFEAYKEEFLWGNVSPETRAQYERDGLLPGNYTCEAEVDEQLWAGFEDTLKQGEAAIFQYEGKAADLFRAWYQAWRAYNQVNDPAMQALVDYTDSAVAKADADLEFLRGEAGYLKDLQAEWVNSNPGVEPSGSPFQQSIQAGQAQIQALSEQRDKLAGDEGYRNVKHLLATPLHERDLPRKLRDLQFEYVKSYAQDNSAEIQTLQDRLGGPIVGRNERQVRDMVTTMVAAMGPGGANVDVDKVVTQILRSPQINGDDPDHAGDLTIRPIAMGYYETGIQMLTGLFEVRNSAGETHYVDLTGKVFDSKDEFLDDNSQFREKGILVMPKGLDTSKGAGGSVDYKAIQALHVSGWDRVVDPVVAGATAVAGIVSLSGILTPVAAPIALAGGAYLGTKAVMAQAQHLDNGGSWGDRESVVNMLSVATTALPMFAGGLRGLALYGSGAMSGGRALAGGLGVTRWSETGLGSFGRYGRLLPSQSELSSAMQGLQGAAVKTAWGMDAAATGGGAILIGDTLEQLAAYGRGATDMSALELANAIVGLGTGVHGTAAGVRGLRTSRPFGSSSERADATGDGQPFSPVEEPKMEGPDQNIPFASRYEERAAKATDALASMKTAEAAFLQMKSEWTNAKTHLKNLKDQAKRRQPTDDVAPDLAAKLQQAEMRVKELRPRFTDVRDTKMRAGDEYFEARAIELLGWSVPELSGESRFLNGKQQDGDPGGSHAHPDGHVLFKDFYFGRDLQFSIEAKNNRNYDDDAFNKLVTQLNSRLPHLPAAAHTRHVVVVSESVARKADSQLAFARNLNLETNGNINVEDVFFLKDIEKSPKIRSATDDGVNKHGQPIYEELAPPDGVTSSSDRLAPAQSSKADKPTRPEGNLPESNQSRPQSLSAAFHPEGAGQSSDPNAPTIPPALRSAEDKSSKKTGPVDIASEGGLQTSLIMVPEHLTTRPSPQVPNPGTISWPKAQKVEPHTHEDLETLTLPEIESLAEPQISTIPGDQLALVSPGQFRKFTPVQFTWMSKQWDALSVPQLVAFQKTHAGNMTADQKATVDLVLKSAQARELQNAAEIFNPMGASSYTLWSSLPPDWMVKAAVVGFAWRGLAFTAQALFPKTTASHTKLGRFLNGANGISFIVTSPGSAAPFLDTGANPAVNGTFTLGNSIFGTKSTYDAMGARSSLGFASDYIGNIAYLGGSAFYTTQVLSSPSAVTAGTIFTLGSAEFLASAVRKNNTYRRDIPRTDEDIAAAAKADKRWALMDKIALGAFGIGMGLFAYNSLNPDPEEDASRNEESSAPPDFSPEPETKPEPEEHAGEYSQLVVTADEGLNLRALPEQDAEIVAILQPDTFVQQTGEPMADGRRFWVPVEGYATDGSRRQGWVADDYTMLHPEGGRTSQGRVNPELEQSGFEWVEVKPGQTLGGIARGSRRDTAATVMLNLDHIVDPSLLFEGDRIYLPIG